MTYIILINFQISAYKLALLPFSQLEYNEVERRSRRSLSMRDMLTSSLRLQTTCCSSLWVVLTFFPSSSSSLQLSNSSFSLNSRHSRFSNMSFSDASFRLLELLHPSHPYSYFFNLLIYFYILHIHYCKLFHTFMLSTYLLDDFFGILYFLFFASILVYILIHECHGLYFL